MVRHHQKLREPGWQRRAVINAVGSVTTGLIAIIVVVSKFTEGAWIPAVLIPIMVFAFSSIGKHYDRVRAAVHVEPTYRSPRRTHYVRRARRVGQPGRARRHAYARTLSPERIIAVSVVADAEEQDELTRQWDDFNLPIELHTISSPYRELTQPVLVLPRRARRGEPRRHDHRGHPRVRHRVEDQLLHNQSALRPEGAAALPPEHRRDLGAGAGRSS